MLRKTLAIRRVKSLLSGVIISAAIGVSPSYAQDMTAGSIMERMGAEERNAYLSGVIEGLAYARYAKDGKQTDGMACIYEWFYQAEGTRRKIHQAFERFADYTPGAVLAAMVEKECGV